MGSQSSKRVRLPTLMMKEIENVLNSRQFCSLPRRQNLFLTPPEVVKLYKMLCAEQVWFNAFMEMVVDFEIYPGDEAQRLKRVRAVFDKWSNGKGLMPHAMAEEPRVPRRPSRSILFLR